MFTPAITLKESTSRFIAKVHEINPKLKVSLIAKAYRFSWNAHRHQIRESGEPFLAHPIAVALILAEQKLDPITIAAGLLHDVLEDTAVTFEMIREDFGDEIAQLVDGVTKIDSLQAKTRYERQVETYRKMLLSMARDLRVIIIKFADRLHNLRTLKFLKPEKIKAIATETLEIYAPLAHRLGMAKLKWELEDHSFKYLHTEEYNLIVSRVVSNRYERERIIDFLAVPLKKRLEKEGIKCTVVGRPKHFYSIFRKMEQRHRTFEEIYDLLAVRVITNSIRECYIVLGVIHGLWKPIQDKFKDYISTPKSNGYQSLHTSVMGPEGHIIEIQIRTWEMHQIAEDGIAAHWLYKEDSDKKPSNDDKTLTWLKNLIEWQKDLTDSTEFYEFFKVDLYHSEIFVFTPKGDLITLPKGSTVLDFAFSVHTQLGLHCIGARIDGQIEPNSTELRSGSTVEILHLSTKNPSIDWLKDAKTIKARSAIKRWLKTTGKQESISLGKQIVSAHYRKLHLDSGFNEHLTGLLEYLGLTTEENLYEFVGKGDIPVQRVIQYFTIKKVKKGAGSPLLRLVDSIRGKKMNILVGGSGNLMTRYARCCNPVPGDAIIGFITKGRGISVHRTDCRNALLFSDDEERAIMVGWEGEKEGIQRFPVYLDIIAENRKGLLHDITKVFSEIGVDILEGTISTDNQHVYDSFQVEISDRAQLKRILRSVQKIKGVERVTRARSKLHSSDDQIK